MRSSFAYVVNDIKLTAAGEVAFENERPDIQALMQAKQLGKQTCGC